MRRELLLAESGHINIGKAFDWIVTELNDNIQWLFDFITTVLGWCIDNLTTVLDFSVDLPGPVLTLPGDAGTIALLPDHTVIILVMAALAWLVRSWQFALFSVIALWVLDNMDLWSEAASSLSLVIVASVIIVVIAIPLGIAAAKNQRVSQVVRPVLDFMQTLPPFVYLIPGIFFFGLGTVPGVVATVVFAMAPGVRLTELGIRQVDPEMVEAGEAFGATPRSILFRIQFPLALPTVMAGINQIIMLSLSMVVIAGMVGAGGLGGTVYEAISHVDIAAGFEGGLGVVILAIYLDRLTSALTNRSAVARAERTAAQSN
ncbi:proline/glycine betaine ABC transporter permease [Nocardia sp. BMG51109]|uniref:ABC transporter permease n=1 Tax=Nocardia sp. BMG51109 TaxID=1056816 RepID=UPI000467D949|nr:ABC transporter permease subunit [Nocardia sp. BMG51109]